MGSYLVSLVSFVSVSLAASYLFFRLRIPAGFIIGPIFVFTFLKFLGVQPALPAHTDTVIISVFGVYFATQVRGVINITQKSFYLPLLLTIVWFFGLALLSSYLLRQISDIGITTSYLSVIPGGIAEMNIITLSYNANVSIINTFHLTRLFSIILLVPAVLKIAYKGRIETKIEGPRRFFPKQSQEVRASALLPIFLCGAVGSITFILLDVPAGGLMGSLLFVVVYEAATKTEAHPPDYLFVLIVSFLGGTIGLNTDIEVFRSLNHLLLPVAVITVITMTGSAVLAALIHFLFRREYLPTLLGVMPGGLSVMFSIAQSVTTDLFYVASLQTIRLLTAVVIIPNLLLILGLIVPQ
jgi:uncharacterized protein